MRAVTFAPALSAVEEDSGGFTLRGFPMTSAFVDIFPVDITVNVVVTVCTLNGDEYDPVRYLVAIAPNGERVSEMQFGWHWDDSPNGLVKFRAFLQELPIHADAEGTYTLALYSELHAPEPMAVFPLAIYRNPTIPPPGGGFADMTVTLPGPVQ